MSPAELIKPGYAVNRLDEPPLLEDAIDVSDRGPINTDINQTLDDAFELLASEIARLQAALDTCRRLDHPRRNELVRWHVRRLDERHDVLEQLQGMIVANRAPGARIH